MKKFLALFAIIFLQQINATLKADEGMWLPIFLGQGPEAEMQRLGMKITADDIYNVNKPSIKDAVCLFGGGCTASIISSQGLLLTNHHCGYSAIQSHSSVEHDYLTDGFWAKSFEEELSNPSLKVFILSYMEEVTSKVLSGVMEGMAAEKRKQIIANNIALIEKEATKGKKIQVKIQPFFHGNQYILMAYNVFSDIRLVGAPPSRIGKFGGDTDNWMWPRQTGDFAMFRIYTDKDNNPAEYSKDNIPYKAPYHLTISLKGVQENDFTFVYGFPGSTQEYLPAVAVERIVNYDNPSAIKIRGKRLEVYKKYMLQSRQTRIQYSAKYASVENFYKKMIGESKGIISTDIIDQKKVIEKKFQEWASNNKDKPYYANIISDFEKIYKDYSNYNLAADYYFEAGIGIEILRYTRIFEKLVTLSKGKKENDEELNKYLDALKKNIQGFFKNYNPQIDKEVMGILLKYYYDDMMPLGLVPEEIIRISKDFNGDFQKFADMLFNKSIMVNESKLTAFLNEYKPGKAKMLEQDPAYKLSVNMVNYYINVLLPKTEAFQKSFDELYRNYISGLMEMQPNRKFYPDANMSLRIAYGQVKGFKPRDGITYDYFTTLKGVIEKEDSTVYDYVVDDKLKALYHNKDYGRYADKDGSMHVAFIASNHTTGGNSGSPVFNAYGHLIGINFDRVWEGTMSDIVYDPEICRNISMDIRYTLFVVDKYAGSKRLIDELTFAP